jgi:hypothetical protein
MHETIAKIGSQVVRGACVAALAIAAVACAGTLRADDGRAAQARAAAPAGDPGAPRDEQAIEDRATRAALAQGKDYVDAIAEGHAAAAAARHAAAVRSAEVAGSPASTVK